MPTTRAGTESGTVASQDATAYEQEWRQGVTAQLQESAKTTQATAVILERVLARLDGHDGDIRRLDARPDPTAQLLDHDARLKALGSAVNDLTEWRKEAPDEKRQKQELLLSIVALVLSATCGA